MRWYTEFIKCETDETGRVTGVIARDVQGERPYLRINASKGVILSTGGYGNNLEMMEDRQAWNQKIRIAAPARAATPPIRHQGGVVARRHHGPARRGLHLQPRLREARPVRRRRGARPLVLVRRAAPS